MSTRHRRRWGGYAHLLRNFDALAFLFVLRIDGLLFLFDEFGLSGPNINMKPDEFYRRSALGDMHLLDGKLFIRLDLDLPSLLQGLLLDESHLDTPCVE